MFLLAVGIVMDSSVMAMAMGSKAMGMGMGMDSKVMAMAMGSRVMVMVMGSRVMAMGMVMGNKVMAMVKDGTMDTTKDPGRTASNAHKILTRSSRMRGAARIGIITITTGKGPMVLVGL
jgi:hypothetical protein